MIGTHLYSFLADGEIINDTILHPCLPTLALHFGVKLSPSAAVMRNSS